MKQPARTAATKARKWTADEDQRLRSMKAEGKLNAVIAKALKRTEVSVTSRTSILKGRAGR